MTRPLPHPFTLRQWQYAIAVADLRSFRRAAEACRVAQPSLSAQIAQLEEAIGVQLFERTPRAVLVTERGAPLLDRARRLLVEADDLREAAAAKRDPFHGTLRVGVIPTVAPYLLPEVAPVLRARWPRLQLLWIEEKTAPLVERVSAGELDAGIVALESDLGDLERAPIGRDAFVLAAPQGHALARGRGPATEEHLHGESVLLLDDGHCFRDQALSFCARSGADEASVRATSLSTLAQMVAGGAGVTLLPSIAVPAENRAGGLSIRSFGPRGPARTLALVWRKSAPHADAMRAIAEALRDAIERVLAAPSKKAR